MQEATAYRDSLLWTAIQEPSAEHATSHRDIVKRRASLAVRLRVDIILVRAFNSIHLACELTKIHAFPPRTDVKIFWTQLTTTKRPLGSPTSPTVSRVGFMYRLDFRVDCRVR